MTMMPPSVLLLASLICCALGTGAGSAAHINGEDVHALNVSEQHTASRIGSSLRTRSDIYLTPTLDDASETPVSSSKSAGSDSIVPRGAGRELSDNNFVQYSMVYYSPQYDGFVTLQAPMANDLSEKVRWSVRRRPSLGLAHVSLNGSFVPYGAWMAFADLQQVVQSAAPAHSTPAETNPALRIAVIIRDMFGYYGDVDAPTILWHATAGDLFGWMPPLILGDFVLLLDSCVEWYSDNDCIFRQLDKHTGEEVSRVVYPRHVSYVVAGCVVPSVLFPDRVYLLRGDMSADGPYPDMQARMLHLESWEISEAGLLLLDTLPIQMGYPLTYFNDGPLSVSANGRLLYVVVTAAPFEPLLVGSMGASGPVICSCTMCRKPVVSTRRCWGTLRCRG
jgi:hypothetical protein